MAGLFLLNGAQFLGVATIAVYAGAIVVTFLFVLMLAQPEGHSFYDRVSWGTMPAALGIAAGMLFAAAMTWAVLDYDPATPLVAAGQTRQILTAEHVAALGGELFGPQLVLVEVAGVLLLAALVGAVAMASHGAYGRAMVTFRQPPGRGGRIMNETALLQHYLVLGGMLFGIGLTGFLIRRNVIVMFLCVEMMLQGVSLNLIAWGRFHDRWDGQVLVIFLITVAACEAAIALVLILMLCRHAGNLDIASWQAAREEGLPALCRPRGPRGTDSGGSLADADARRHSTRSRPGRPTVPNQCLTAASSLR